MIAAPEAGPPPAFQTVGSNDVTLFGLAPAERMRRFAANAGLDPAAPAPGSIVLADLGYACDPAWLPYLRDRPGTVLTLEGHPALAHALDRGSAVVVAEMMAARAFQVPSGHIELRAEDATGLHSATLRKREAPFLMPLTPATADAAERASYDGAYKGVTDLLTLYLWRRPAFYLTRWAAAAGLSPNLITAVGAALCVLAFYLFWIGAYWPGVAAGFVFMVLDTVDGKLARCTGTSSKWGNVFDHGIDLVHPPFWWWAWAHGLEAYGTPMALDGERYIVSAILIFYVAQRGIEGLFIRRFGMHIHVWRRIDSRFRLITARRNPNMVILVAFLLFQRPDLGLVAVALWTVFSYVFHQARYVQAEGAMAVDGKVVSWLG